MNALTKLSQPNKDAFEAALLKALVTHTNILELFQEEAVPLRGTAKPDGTLFTDANLQELIKERNSFIQEHKVAKKKKT